MATITKLSAAAAARRAAHLALDLKATDVTLLDLKANDVVLLNLKGVTDMADFFVIASGTSDTHVGAIADSVIDGLKKERVRPLNVEGQREGRWVLIDYFDFVVHVFHPAAREFYQLERLWGDAPAHVLEPTSV